jgi:hypothetical protein
MWWYANARQMAVLLTGLFGLEWSPLCDNFATKNGVATCLDAEVLQQLNDIVI